jgi:hypothetical protein
MFVVSLYYENHNCVCWLVIASSRNFLQMCRYLKSKEQLLQSYIDYVVLLRLRNTNQPSIRNKESVFMCRVSMLFINAIHWSWISLGIIKHDPVSVISDDIYIHFCYKNVIKCDIFTCNSLQNIKITPEMDSSYSNTSKTWRHSWLYYFWFSSYDSGLLRKAAILDLSNMAATAGAQLGSHEKLACYGHIYPWSKIGACRTIWTIMVFLKIKPPDYWWWWYGKIIFTLCPLRRRRSADSKLLPVRHGTIPPTGVFCDGAASLQQSAFEYTCRWLSVCIQISILDMF